MKRTLIPAVAVILLITQISCGLNNALKGAIIGAGAGAGAGAIVGKATGSTARGAIIGARVYREHTERKAARSETQPLQEGAPQKPDGWIAHGPSPGIPAAFLMAARIRR